MSRISASSLLVGSSFPTEARPPTALSKIPRILRILRITGILGFHAVMFCVSTLKWFPFSFDIGVKSDNDAAVEIFTSFLGNVQDSPNCGGG